MLLHGYQDDPTSLFEAVEELDPEARFRFVVPRAPFETPDGPAWFAATHPDEDPTGHSHRRLVDSLAELNELIREESAAIGTAPSDTIVIGYSQGGATALALALRADAPFQVAAVAAIAGYLPDTDGLTWNFEASAKTTRVLLVHGTDDDQVPVLQSRSASKVLRRHGIDCEFVEIETGHVLDEDLLIQVAEWLDRQ